MRDEGPGTSLFSVLSYIVTLVAIETEYFEEPRTFDWYFVDSRLDFTAPKEHLEGRGKMFREKKTEKDS